ncbi:DUF4180 domain-containing protein [Sedimentibacter hydroxybenzoicus DSM 7310]|uniref:DUF4180 domain-containing protein n=1 Tax=Sedimentibacter hydroxybenzoicus DSM 7310 TaxID=1123245 RepID=A0A974BMF0_SEDHY|nr:DUF4180 domain-containing protein [Sedimentibacter hydroxybenzoicus]NYB75260.1 DUF4180 domain-containing protein [Sedimentibacter hydroxybenzoicus DSM 7310]
MKYTFLGKNNSLLYIESEDILIYDAQSALDFMATINYEKDCNRIILDKKAINEEFFILSSGIAGEICQKIVNYKFKLAIIGDYSKYTSKSLRDFIYECNRGNDIFFADNLQQAVDKLDSAR